MTRSSVRTLKVTGLVLALIPAGLLLLLGLAETTGGIVSGVQHFVQVAPLVALAVLAWLRPRLGGLLLLAAAVLVGIVYALITRGAPSAIQWLVGGVLIGMPALAGLLFWLAGRQRQA
ncbi:MAG: hypothetical protein U0556_07190 [Dehalococcoidia bacterium]